MKIARIKSNLIYSDGSFTEIDKVFDTPELAEVEYDRLVLLESETVCGSVMFEMCDHFSNEGGCQLVDSASWGEPDV